MLTLALAVLFASFVGSLHCVGMCGPFALWATQGGVSRSSLAFYHLGRLTTFLSAGLAAGVIGSALSISGQVAGWQSMAATIAGGLLIFAGLSRLLLMMPVFQQTAPAERPSRIAGLLQQAKPVIASQGPTARGYLTGLLTTWLPCGWLYLFVLVAAGTGDVLQAVMIMFAFWLGTVPALTALTLGVKTLVPRFRTSIPVIAAVLLVVTGLYTVTGRASADLTKLVGRQIEAGDNGLSANVASLMELSEQPLPCCDP